MNKKIHFILLLGSLLVAPCFAEKPSQSEHSKKRKSIERHRQPKKKRKVEEKFWFRYKDEPLADIINELAKRKNINVVLPAGKEAIVNRLTFQYPEKITLSEAWRRMLSILKICGYTITKENDFYFLTGADPKRFRDANRQPYPLYSHIKPEDLPDSDEKIRYIHYFSNLQVGGGGTNGITPLIQALLSKDATIVTDPSSNGLIITDFSRNIASVMHIIKELDSHGFTDAIDFIKLKHTSADTVARLFQELINSNTPQQGQQYGGQIQPSGDNSTSQYFSKNTRIVAEMRTNSLIFMGKKTAIDQAKGFIEKNIDISLGTGESVLHIYDLQYLKAREFQPILSNIVNSSSNQQQGSYGNQSSGSIRNSNGEQYFQGVIIAAEQTGGEQGAGGSGGYWGGSGGGNAGASAPAQAPQTSNRLIIAARRQDWIRIEKLIEELDKPQLQVAIEALIVDLTLTGDQSLASQMRNKKGLGIKNTNFQTTNIGGIVLDNSQQTQSAEALRANLLNMATANESGQPSGTTLGNATGSNLVTGSAGGSLLLSFKDKATNGMWLVTELLSNFQDIKVLSQPFIVAMNNQNSSFASNDSRLLDGDINTSLGGSVQNKVRKDAMLGVSVTPQISHSGKINLGISIKVEEYGTSTETLHRNLQTNANINDGEVLVLGGLTKTKVVDTVMGTPGLKDIPLFGWLFKKKAKVTTKEHLLIFLCPRIIHTAPNKYFDPFTRDKMLAVNNMFAKGENFDTLKDPITHWFFGSPDSEIASKRIHAFNDKSMYSSSQNYIADQQRVGVKNILVDPKKQVDRNSIMKTTAYVPPPTATTSTKTAEEKAVENYIKVDRPAKKIYVAEAKKKEKPIEVSLSEEEELKKLFASLDISKA